MHGTFEGILQETGVKPGSNGRTFRFARLAVGKPNAGTLDLSIPENANGVFEKAQKLEDQKVRCIVNVRMFEGRAFFDLVDCMKVGS
jgi:hypothetical protein